VTAFGHLKLEIFWTINMGQIVGISKVIFIAGRFKDFKH